MLQHLLRVRVRDQEGDIIALSPSISQPLLTASQNPRLSSRLLPIAPLNPAYLNSLSPQDKERLRSLRQKPRELMHQDILNIICLFYLDANPHTIHRRLYEHLFILVSGYVEGVEEDFGRACGFDFGNIVALGGLGGKIGEGKGGCQGRADTLEVGTKRLRLRRISRCARLRKRVKAPLQDRTGLERGPDGE